jgi:hypothetical protein
MPGIAANTSRVCSGVSPCDRKSRIPARRGIFFPGDPPGASQQRGAQQGIVIDRTERLLAARMVAQRVTDTARSAWPKP